MNAESVYQRTRTMLGDASGVKFSDVQLQAALSQVVAHMDSQVPHMITLQFSAVVADQMLILPDSYELRNVLSVECTDFDPPLKMTFRYDVSTPGQVQLLDTVQSSAMNWCVKIVSGHQIEGLDGAETSTIPDYCEMLLVSGTAAYALQIRNAQLAESANQETMHYQALQQNMRVYEDQFLHLLQVWQSAQPAIEPILPDGPGWQLDD